MPFLACLGGSLREKSVTRAALRAAMCFAQEKGFETELLDVRALNLPMYLPDTLPDDYPPPHRDNLQHLLDTCRRADAMVWASPTYHGTVSGVFKNALDCLEMLSEDTPPYLHQCPVGLITVNDPVTFGAMMNSAYELNAWLAPTHVTIRRDYFDPDLQHLHDERARRRLMRLMDELLFFLERNRG